MGSEPLTGKPKAIYKGRLERYPDADWLIWSNKWGCWYRPNGQGYTGDIAQAGVYTRAQAAKHMAPPGTPKSYRDTEPFPVSAVRKHVAFRRAQLDAEYQQKDAALAVLEVRLATFGGRP